MEMNHYLNRGYMNSIQLQQMNLHHFPIIIHT
uniref:Uncharacterized protein n=1 Tax=Schistosoma curassoni TaxID=6186 RepID=A0A183JMD8_9TREM